jgi:hypothetical protein
MKLVFELLRMLKEEKFWGEFTITFKDGSPKLWKKLEQQKIE